jgi:glyoxylase-like metal-dependent hydrolase (beta-lactamase superfamily II)
MFFRQIFDRTTCTYTYLLADGGQAVLIDPVLERAEQDLQLLEQLGLQLKYVLETHVHADHVTAAATLRDATGCEVVLGRETGATGANLVVADRDRLNFGSRHIVARETPGHTAGCITYVLDDESMAFTGDTLFVRGCGRTDFQEGSAQQLYQSVNEKIFSLPDACRIYPGHDYKGQTVSTVGEERRFNPRLGGGRSEAEFVAIMDGLNLPPPAKIKVAVPANLNVGAGAVALA